jgi:hypothetical protein
MHGFPWMESVAQELLDESQGDNDLEIVNGGSPSAEGARYATRGGIAFKAVASNDGTWHGYPVPWEQVPEGLKERWIRERKVTRRDILKYSLCNIKTRGGILPNEWAMEVDSE